MPSVAIDLAIRAELGSLPKRERTRRQIIASAMNVLSRQGIDATAVQEIAAHAGVTAGTFYNHFNDKGEVVGAVATWTIGTLEKLAAESRKGLRRGAERVANGCHRYLAIARKEPSFALFILQLAADSPKLLDTVGASVLGDIRLGVRQKAFRIFSEKAAVDQVHGLVMLAMRTIAQTSTPASYDRAIVATVLQGLGLPSRRAMEFSQRQALAIKG